MAILRTDLPAIAAQLDDEALHVWQLRYDPHLRRTPLLALLGAYLGLDAEQVQLTEGEHGRPQLSPAHAGVLDFNWSHSGSCAVVAIGRQVVAGIDVERRRPRPRALEIAQRYFCPAEAAWLAAQPEAQRADAFLAFWTAKEAVLKALGRGLAFGLHRLEIDIATGRPQLRRLENDHAGAWQLLSLEVDAEHRAAIAWRGPPRRIRQWVLADAG